MAVEPESTEMAQTTMNELVLGTYEGGLVGVDVGEELKQSFGFSAHLGCVKSMSASHGMLVTGGSDEMVRIYDLESKKETGALYQHSASVGCLQLYKKSHLISASDDGKMIIWRTADWEALHSFKAHRAAVVGLSTHPSGRLALSIGMDKKLRMWDLMTGTCALTQDLEQVPLSVQFAPEGVKYALLYSNKLVVVDGDQTKKVDGRGFTDLLFVRGRLVIGTATGDLLVLDASSLEVKQKIEAGVGRVKKLARLAIGFALVNPDGTVAIFQVPEDVAEEIKPMGSIDAMVRCTAFASDEAWEQDNTKEAKKAKKARKEERRRANAEARKAAEEKKEKLAQRKAKRKAEKGGDAAEKPSAGDKEKAPQGENKAQKPKTLKKVKKTSEKAVVKAAAAQPEKTEKKVLKKKLKKA